MTLNNVIEFEMWESVTTHHESPSMQFIVFHIKLSTQKMYVITKSNSNTSEDTINYVLSVDDNLLTGKIRDTRFNHDVM